MNQLNYLTLSEWQEVYEMAFIAAHALIGCGVTLKVVSNVCYAF